MNFQQDQIAPKIAQFLKWKGCWPLENLELAGKAGSNRTYFRLKKGLVSYVLSTTHTEEVDFHHFLRITQFYRLLDVPVPKVYCIDDFGRQVLLEDLGSSTLWHVVQEKPSHSFYLQAIDLLSDLQTRVTSRADECPDISSRVFGPTDLKWESDYFYREFIEKKILTQHHDTLLKEKFNALMAPISNSVAQLPLRVMHRDFQSQNLMVQGNKLRIIDFQGSRLGGCFYDLASILFDPYVCLPLEEVKELFRYFLAKVPVPFNQEEAWIKFLDSAIQRLMQAVGAYCFLSTEKQMKSFEKYLSPGLSQLHLVLEASNQTQILTYLQPLDPWKYIDK